MPTPPAAATLVVAALVASLENPGLAVPSAALAALPSDHPAVPSQD